jgi:hypothetical protein
MKFDQLVEAVLNGLAKGKTPQDLADKHGVPLDQIEQQISAGLKVELEHTKDPSVAKEIAMDHLFEDPDYYTKLKTIEKKSKVFLDMDGLLADLFEKVAQEIHQKSYKDLSIEEKNEAKRIWTDKEEAMKFFDKQGGIEAFFANLPTFGDRTKQIIDTVTEFAGEYRICSHPAAKDREASKRGKIEWIKKHLSPAPVEMFFPQNKADYALNEDGLPNILIDDFPPYIKHWRDAGGIAIQMRTDNFESAQEVKEFLQSKLDQVASASST